jgi:chromosome partitioning protein
MTKVISLFNEKGGVGKTTIATTLAAGIARRGYSVMLIDADPQANATQAFAVDPYPGFYDLMARDVEFGRQTVRRVQKECYAMPDEDTSGFGTLYLLGGNLETRNIIMTTEKIEGFLQRMLDLSEANIVDYVIVDNSPVPTMLHTQIYLGSDVVLYPTRLEAWSIGGLTRSISYRVQADKIRKAWGMPPLEVWGIIPVATRLSTTEHTENYTILVEKYGLHSEGGLLMRPIAERIRWTQCASYRRTIFALELPTPGTASYDAHVLIEEVMSHAHQT